MQLSHFTKQNPKGGIPLHVSSHLPYRFLRSFLWCARKLRAGRLNVAYPILLLGALISEHVEHMFLFVASVVLAEGLIIPLRVYNSMYREKRERRRYGSLRSAIRRQEFKHICSLVGVSCIAPAIVIGVTVGVTLLFRLPW